MRLKNMFVLLALLPLVAAGCAQEGGGRAQRVTVTATDFKFSGMPEKITGGVIDLTFRNDGEAEHEFFIAQIGNTSAKTLSAAIAKFDEGAAFPSYLRIGAVPTEVEPDESFSTKFTLPPGEYTLSCTLTDAPGDEKKDVAPHATLGMFQRITVEGGDDEPELPQTGAEFVAHDYTFDVPKSFRAGRNEFVFRNASSKQWHHMILNVFPEGTSESEAVKAFETLITLDDGEDPPKGTPEPEQAGHTGIFSPGLGQTVDLEFEAGRTYVAACFIHDVEGGPPHAVAHKMYKAFTVSAQ